LQSGSAMLAGSIVSVSFDREIVGQSIPWCRKT
jgi:hypothetical protein